VSRSIKHSPISGITKCRSEKTDKRIANRKLRAKARSIMNRNTDPDGLVVPVLSREVLDQWCMGKDGKRYYDPLRFPELMRK
jgi:hypothetical protein